MPAPAPLSASRPRRTDRVRPAPAQAASVPEAPAPEADADAAPHDYTFAGGKLLAADGTRQSAAPRRLYDTVSVTYADDSDGYDDIKRLMDGASGRKLKNPTDFAN